MRIYDLSVSKLHAELNINSNHYLPARLVAHSPNGILLPENKQRISKGGGANLVDGAIFQIAGRPFRFERARSTAESVLVEVSLTVSIISLTLILDDSLRKLPLLVNNLVSL